MSQAKNINKQRARTSGKFAMSQELALHTNHQRTYSKDTEHLFYALVYTLVSLLPSIYPLNEKFIISSRSFYEW